MPAIHVTNGDSVRGTLREIVADPVAIVADPLHEGPAPAGLEGREWCEVRARFLAGESPDEYDQALQALTEWDDSVADVSAHDEVVLWFEHDLFDQLLLIRLLDRLVRLPPDTTPSRVSLICIGAFPGIERFVGLGQLTAGQLASLVDTRRPVTAAQYADAHDAWTAFRADDPTHLARLAKSRSHSSRQADALPFLADALKRFLQEYPSTVNGLSRSADAILQALVAGPLGGHELFVWTQAREPRPFMGDSTLFRIAERLASCRVPLVAVEDRAGRPPDPADLGRARFTLTEAGREVAGGRQDAVALNGVDEWRGGVHLRGATRSPWRWDPTAETLVS